MKINELQETLNKSKKIGLTNQNVKNQIKLEEQEQDEMEDENDLEEHIQEE